MGVRGGFRAGLCLHLPGGRGRGGQRGRGGGVAGGRMCEGTGGPQHGGGEGGPQHEGWVGRGHGMRPRKEGGMSSCLWLDALRPPHLHLAWGGAPRPRGACLACAHHWLPVLARVSHTSGNERLTLPVCCCRAGARDQGVPRQHRPPGAGARRRCAGQAVRLHRLGREPPRDRLHPHRGRAVQAGGGWAHLEFSEGAG